MQATLDTRRYLTNFDSRRISHVLTDVLVIGTGVAGMRAAIEAARFGEVILLCKDEFGESATRYAQGGIAAARDDDTDAQRHFDDTLRAGAGVNRPEVVRKLVDDGPARIAELIDWGIKLDRNGGSLDLTREGGHSVNRIVHALGDQTGRELVRTLRERVRRQRNIRIFEHCFLIDFVTECGTCLGAISHHPKHGHQLVWAHQTILASGGCGQIWRETTNPPGSTGDGIAAAFRAGARLCNMELMQFHPTTLYIAGAGRALVSEAVRGEGAHLLDRDGKRFLFDHHKDGELAPRDIVSRAIHQHLVETRSNSVFLDTRHLENFAERFPGLARLCTDFQIDPAKDLIPVRPSAHYMIGGVDVVIDGKTSIEGLLCCGEAACTGVHGANRMASNSLLEGLVFGRMAGEGAGVAVGARNGKSPVSTVVSEIVPSTRTPLDVADIRNSLTSVMWRNAGIIRSESRLRETCEILNFWGHYVLDKTFDTRNGWELQNELIVAWTIATSAQMRNHSIGVHYREDCDEASPEDFFDVIVTGCSSDAQLERRQVTTQPQ
jgi:L-aspartate oxidase